MSTQEHPTEAWTAFSNLLHQWMVNEELNNVEMKKRAISMIRQCQSGEGIYDHELEHYLMTFLTMLDVNYKPYSENNVKRFRVDCMVENHAAMTDRFFSIDFAVKYAEAQKGAWTNNVPDHEMHQFTHAIVFDNDREIMTISMGVSNNASNN